MSNTNNNKNFKEEEMKRDNLSKISQMIDGISKEYENFRDKEYRKTSQEVFEDAHKINSYSDLHYYFTCEDEENILEEIEDAFNSENIDSFINTKDILYCLYEFLLSALYTSTETWEAIAELINLYIENNFKNEKEEK